MNSWLVKADPDSDYSISELEKDSSTLWDGVHNYQAINFIKQWEVGDLVYFYHSQKEKAIVGLAEVASVPAENKSDARTSWAAWLKFVKKYEKTVNIAEIKASGICDDFLLVRNSRLSVMPVPDNIQKWLSEKLK